MSILLKPTINTTLPQKSPSVNACVYSTQVDMKVSARYPVIPPVDVEGHSDHIANTQ